MIERIQKILSAHGVASRREAERMVTDGRVKINGFPASIGQGADIECDEIEVDGVALTSKAQSVYIMLNKPRGYITTVSDDRGRKTVMDLVQDAPEKVYPVGRLDMESEGLLLMTNDGLFANTVAHPSFCKQKTYEVRVRGDAAGAARLLCRPIIIDSHLVEANSASLIKHTKEGGILHISVSEGRNRQIRKMCSKVELEVMALKRISIADLELGALNPGKWRHLTEGEVKSLCDRE